jgi:hypothetical protein
VEKQVGNQFDRKVRYMGSTMKHIYYLLGM